MQSLIATLHVWAIGAGSLGVFSVAFLQEIIPPIPSTAVSATFGFLLFAGEPMTAEVLYDLFIRLGLPIAAGLTLGSVVIYYAARWGGAVLIGRWGKWIGVTNKDIEKLRERLRWTVIDEVLLFSLRATPFVPSVALNLLAGLVRWNIVSFTILTFLGTIIRAMWSAAIGWQIGTALGRYETLVEQLHVAFILVLFVGAVAFIWYRRRKMRQKLSNDGASQGILEDITE